MSILLLIVIYFLAASFLSGQLAGQENIFLSFLELQINLVKNNLLFFIALASGGALILMRFKNKKIKVFKIVQKIVLLLLLGFFASFIGLFVIAFVHLNTLSFAIRFMPKFVGVISDVTVIEKRLEKENLLHDIVPFVNGGKRIVKSVATNQSGSEGFYGSKIVPSIPEFLVLPLNSIKSNVLMIGNTIALNDINSSEFQSLSPKLAYLMIKEYFPKKQFKKYPQISVMDKDGYFKFRQDNFSENLKMTEALIVKVNESIEKIESDIDSTRDDIQQSEKELSVQKKERERSYTKCVNEGYYDKGVFIRVNTREFCSKQMEKQDILIKTLSDDLSNLKSMLADSEEKLVKDKSLIKFYEGQKILAKEDENYVSLEKAVFYPLDTIKIARLSTNNPKILENYFTILIHEYLHFTTYEDGNFGLGSLFFNEGLTEYFARKITQNYFKKKTNIAYPVNVKIITQMEKRISDSDLIDVYLKNDREGLIKILDRVYGKNFYRNNLITFESIQYAKSSEEILELANIIMEKIGGEPLTPADIKTDKI